MQVYTPPLTGLEELAPGVWLCPGGRAGAAFVGSRQSARFHALACWFGRQIRPQNQVCFSDADAALAFGYAPCSRCRPLESR